MEFLEKLSKKDIEATYHDPDTVLSYKLEKEPKKVLVGTPNPEQAERMQRDFSLGKSR